LCASDTTDLVFDNCRIPAEDLLGEEGDGFRIAMTTLDSGRIGIAAQSVGVAQAALDAAASYAKEREQFGQPISKFQGLRWMLADMATEIEAARHLTFFAAAKKDRGERYTMEASMAKLFASEMVNRVTARALQIHGGYGYTKEYPVERFYRDARVFTIYEGTSEIQRVVIANHLLGDRYVGTLR
ncbi:MAG: acyl-CoA dehydrogenase family protein, partial [Deltaproteobacteria bacterium]